jgi:hypothetical protein
MGSEQSNGREALTDLLSESATTMTWYLLCTPDALQGNRPTAFARTSRSQKVRSHNSAPVLEKQPMSIFDRCLLEAVQDEQIEVTLLFNQPDAEFTRQYRDK